MIVFIIVGSIVLGLLVILAIAIQLISRFLFNFSVGHKSPCNYTVLNQIPPEFEKYTDFINERNEWTRQQKIEHVSIKSRDGLTLKGYVLRSKNPTKRLVVGVHGFTSSAFQSYSTSLKFFLENDCDMLLMDLRAHGMSEGEYVGFGVLDRYDVRDWLDFANDYFGEGYDIYLHGISMGAATVLMLQSLDLPKNVKGIMADCGYTSAHDIFKKVLNKDFHLPTFPFLKIAARSCKKRAGYGINDVDAREVLAKSRLPILFFHGTSDQLVPFEMGKENYEACTSAKEMFVVEGATHAGCYYADTERYEKTMAKFMGIIKE